LIEGEDDQAAHHIRPNGMEFELKAGDDAKVSASASEPQEEVLALRFTGMP
jgi:hypothetical protein